MSDNKKLKTLKDLLIVHQIGDYSKDSDVLVKFKNMNVYDGDDLKQAAREWIKVIDDVLYGMNDQKTLLPYKPHDFYHMDELLYWINNFFNLDDEG